MLKKLDCYYCGKKHFINVDEEKYNRWKNGELIQNCMPELSPTEREQLISNLCPCCQKIFFGEDNYEESAND